FYFAMVTALSVVLQERLADAVRGRVMALWVMAFGGTIPLGLLVAGPLAERTSISLVMGYGVVAALALAVYAELDRVGNDERADAVVPAPASVAPAVAPDPPAPPPGCP
ncbi:MAG: hypothetical protein M3N37_07095, partial [Actinomycetota bacterium]|nr:hypothetical protein [Actinomycetota bacterium]